MKPIYITFDNDLYEITCDVLGEIVQVTVYRDNRHSVGESLDIENIPPEVTERLTRKLALWWKDM